MDIASDRSCMERIVRVILNTRFSESEFRRLADSAEIVRAPPWDRAEYVGPQPSMWRQKAQQRRRQRDSFQVYPTVYEEIFNLGLLDAANVRIPWIVDPEVVPKQDAVPAQDTEHLRRDFSFNLVIQNRSKHRSLQDDIEGLPGEI